MVTVPEAIEPAMVAQLCIPIVGCAALVTTVPGVDVSGCAQVAAGGTCLVGCSNGYQNVGPDDSSLNVIL